MYGYGCRLEYAGRMTAMSGRSGFLEPVYDFILVINSNLGTISHRY